MKEVSKQRNWEPVPIVFFKLGGTWDMIKKNGQLIGSGGLDDDGLFHLEKSLGLDEPGHIAEKELRLAREVEKSFVSEEYNLIEHLHWVPHAEKYVTGTFRSLFSGDSSHLRASIVAPIVSMVLQFAHAHPDIQVLAAQGTDTADIAIIPLLDVFTFDTSLLPILITGSNRSHREWNSDAPSNFSDLFHLAGAHLPAGSYWIFADHLYRGSDFVKIDPLETRRIENYSTFFAPRLTARFTRKAIEENSLFHHEKGSAVGKNHIVSKITMEDLFASLEAIVTVNLGDQNPLEEEIEKIHNPKHKAVVISAHSLGNVNDPIKFACLEEVKKGKLIFVVSRSLIGEVNERYAASLLSINATSAKGHLISGHKINQHVVRAIAVRALMDNLSQHDAQELLNSYAESRGLLN